MESGFKIMPGGGVTAAALIRNDTDQTLNEIQLELSLQDAGGREVAKTGESLPFCPPRQDCWWGAIFVDSSQFGADHKSIALVKTKILKDLGPRKDTPRLVELTAKGDEFVGASTEGMVFMIGFESGKPTSGMSQNIEKRVSPMAVSAGELKSSAGAQTVRAFLYEGVEQEGH
ncbi:MAG TPA: hypothetical protein VNE62_10385 [Actinomycetota bacterium]|nr:hypothetical protein [Actinomycetota bacterium]